MSSFLKLFIDNMPKTKKAPATDAPARLRIMQVAAILKCRYQRARDLMLSGKLGEIEESPLTVPRTGLDAYLATGGK